MSIVVGTHARIRVEPQTQFQNIREVHATQATAFASHDSAKDRLCGSMLSCQKGMKSQSAARCLACPRLVNFVPKQDSVLVRCLWTDHDPVADLMTLASELVTISPDTPIELADEIARENNIRHLLLVENEKLCGVICRCDLVEPSVPEERVSDRANHCPWTISPETTLAQAAQLMQIRKIGMLPVVERRELLGVVTRGDLRRVGVIDALMDTDQCHSCQGASGVFRHPQDSTKHICLACFAA